MTAAPASPKLGQAIGHRPAEKLAAPRRKNYHVPVTLRRAVMALGVALGAGCPATALAYPYLALRPADFILAGPTDGHLSSLFYNPASIRVVSGSEVLFQGGVHGYLGQYQRSSSLPAGFSPNGQSGPASPAQIRWVNPQAQAALAWDLRSDSVTLGLAFSTPTMDLTDYRSTGQPIDQLSTRYHAVYDQSYSLWGSIAVGLKLKSWLLLGGSFNFGYTRSSSQFLRDGDTDHRHSLGCDGAKGSPCEQWQNRSTVELDVGALGYGFSAGAIIEALPSRLWLGLSYISPLFTNQGDIVPLEGQPSELPWNDGSACSGSQSGASISDRDSAPRCGAARLTVSFPHIMYLGGRLRFPLSPSVEKSADSRRPRALELSSWLRLTIPGHSDQEFQVERSLLEPSLYARPLSAKPAFAVTLGLRQYFQQVTLGEELLYETPRVAADVVSPANLDGHKLDLSLSLRLALYKRLSLLLSVGATWMIFSPEAGQAFDPTLVEACRSDGYDVTTSACTAVQKGLAIPTAAGIYTLGIPHGSAGLEINL
jgi:hypothetical protein